MAALVTGGSESWHKYSSTSKDHLQLRRVARSEHACGSGPTGVEKGLSCRHRRRTGSLRKSEYTKIKINDWTQELASSTVNRLAGSQHLEHELGIRCTHERVLIAGIGPSYCVCALTRCKRRNVRLSNQHWHQLWPDLKRHVEGVCCPFPPCCFFN
jgi:hypothetical protein